MIVKVLRQKAVGCVCVSCQSPSRATACQAGVNKNQSNQQRSLLSRSDTAEGWQQRFICSVFSFTRVLQWWLPLIIALPPPSKVIHQFITKIWDYTVLFYVVTKLLVKLAWGPLTWWYLHAGLMVYLSDCRLLPSVRGTSYPSVPYDPSISNSAPHYWGQRQLAVSADALLLSFYLPSNVTLFF